MSFKKTASYFLSIAILVFTGCGSPSGGGIPDGVTGPAVVGDVSSAYMDVAAGQILNVSNTMEYSLNNGAVWTDCGSSVVDVFFSNGDVVYVRQINDIPDSAFLGTVSLLTGPDLIPGKCYVGTDNWTDLLCGEAGETLGVRTEFSNIGDTNSYSTSYNIAFYISNDKIITSADTIILDYNWPYTATAGQEYVRPYSADDDFVVPSLTPGVYYVGCIVDSNSAVTELLETNNATRPADVAEFTIVDTSVPDSGAFKFINSWGVGGSWENVHDGHYWVTYETMIQQQMPIRYYYNDFSSEYEPTIVAVFDINHDYRDECLVTIGLGNPSAPLMIKQFNKFFSSSVSGHFPFPNNDIVLDISEFAQYINDYNIFMTVENVGTTTGSVSSFSLEFYYDYDESPFKTINGTTGTIPSSSTLVLTASTAGRLNSEELAVIQPNDRADMFGVSFTEEKPTSAELARDMASAGVYVPGRNYNIIVNGMGTGDAPPTEEQWNNMVKLRSVSSSNDRGLLPASVDNSDTIWFPPIGSQGSEGSCTAFSFAYYIQTYTEARERNWDMSGTSWLYTDPSGLSSGGRPDSNLNRIFSPDFIYHQINSGTDDGSNGQAASALIIKVGGATWAAMPYNTSDHTTWPSKAAWREAGRYRGREVGNHYWAYRPVGYFIIYDYGDIYLLKSLLAAGYCVSTSVDASTTGDGVSLYALLDSNDVIDDNTAAIMDTNHAQTVVGYKEGTDWNPADPDN
ncbi:MAG: hypothetical protein JW904_10465 [Spirochaetales bacterium]|nr:hypothetical protein [Spirochaetales bacterium]